MFTGLSEYEEKALTVVAARYGMGDIVWEHGNDTNLQLGQVVWIYSRGMDRRGVVSKLSGKRAEVTYTTEGALKEAYTTCDLYASGRAWYGTMDRDQPEQWARQTPEWQANVRASIADGKAGRYQRFITFTHKDVKRSEVHVLPALEAPAAPAAPATAEVQPQQLQESRGSQPAQEDTTLKTTAPKCSGSLAPLPPHTKTFQAATSKRAICPVCGGRIGLVQPKEGGLKYSTHYRKGHVANGSGARAGKPAAKKAAKASPPKGAPRAALANGSVAASKFITASGTEYAFVRDPESDGKSKAAGVVKVTDSKATHGYSEYPVFVNDAGAASFRNVRQGRPVHGRIA